MLPCSKFTPLLCHFIRFLLFLFILLNNWPFPVELTRYTYDSNGNRILKSILKVGDAVPVETRYVYDSENRLSRLDFTNTPNFLGAKTATFQYDL